MKNPLHYIRKYPQRTKRILGIDYKQFQQLLEQAQLKHDERQAAIEVQKIRVNAKGGGRKHGTGLHHFWITFISHPGNGGSR